MTAHLSIEGLDAGYGGKPVVRGFRLDVAEGEFVSLLGPSGCGKTTVLRAVAGFAPMLAGRVLIGGADVSRMPPERRDVGIVFQNYALFPTMTAFENIAFGLRVARRKEAEIEAEVRRIAEVAGIGDHLSAKPAELSGGQQQRVAIARALVMGAKVLLLDEPLSNLDAKVRQVMRREIRRLQREIGFTALFVTHDQEEALAMSDRVVVMRDGAIEQIGTGRELYLRPASPFVCSFLGIANAPSPSLAAKLVGAPVQGLCFIRPEDVMILTVAEEGLPAFVGEVEFLGALSRVECIVEGESLTVLMRAPEAPVPGDVVRLVLRSGASHVFAGPAPTMAVGG